MAKFSKKKKYRFCVDLKLKMNFIRKKIDEEENDT